MTANAKTFGIDLNYFFEKGAHVAIARKIVFNIANKPVKLVTSADGVQVPVYALSADACQKICEGYYQDTIFEDICQSIALELINLNREGLLDVSYDNGEGEVFWDDLKCDYRTTKKASTKCLDEDKYLDFLDEISIDQNGEEKRVNSFLRLYKAVRTCLGKYSLNNSQKSQLYIYDLMYTDDNGKEHTLTNKSSSYMWEASKQADASLDDYIQRSDVKSFLKYCKKTMTEKMFSRTCEIISDLIVDMSYDEISQDLEISVDAVKKTVQRIRDTWKDNFKVRLEKRKTISPFKPVLSGTIATYRGDTKKRKYNTMTGTGKYSSYTMGTRLHKDNTYIQYIKPVKQVKKTIATKKAESTIDKAIWDYIKKLARKGIETDKKSKTYVEKTDAQFELELRNRAFLNVIHSKSYAIDHSLKDFDLSVIENI